MNKTTLKRLVLGVAIIFVGFTGGRFTQDVKEVKAQQTPDQSYVACVGAALTKYFQAIVSGTRGLDKIKILAPEFNMTYPTEFEIYLIMKSGPGGEYFKPQNYPNFWGFIGNTYSFPDLNLGAYDFYASPQKVGTNWKGDTVGAYPGTQMIFGEFGDSGTNRDHIAELQQEFNKSAADGSIAGINLFAAIDGSNTDPAYNRHKLDPGQIATIVGGSPGKAGQNSGLPTAGESFPQNVQSKGVPNGWVVEIVRGPGDLAAAIRYVNASHAAGYNPVLRTCYGDTCGFAEPQLYINFLKQLNSAISGPVWIVAGPNEPATGSDDWAAPECTPPAKKFDLNDVPCDKTYNDIEAGRPDFHSLRPYPASPCNKEKASNFYMCSQDLVVKDTFEFSPADATHCDDIGAGVKRCYFRIQSSSSNVSLGLNSTTFPIMGNTELVPNSVNNELPQEKRNKIDFKQRVNEYVSWYLNGVSYRAEEIPATIDEVINLSGPIKKLLPRVVQNNERTGQIGAAGTSRHNETVYCGIKDRLTNNVACYNPINDENRSFRLKEMSPTDIGKPSFPYIPFSSTEDLIGQANSGLLLGPGCAGAGAGDETISGVTCADFDAENTSHDLYFAHIEEDNYLGQLLQKTFKTKSVNDAGTAPTDQLEELVKTPYCELVESRSNPGDKLYGELVRPGDDTTKPISGVLTYSANLQCDFVPPAPEAIALCLEGCNSLTGADFDQCQLECNQGSETCQREIFIPFSVKIAPPDLTTTWERFVAGSMSIVKRMFPRVGPGTPFDKLKDIPGKSNAAYRSTNLGVVGGSLVQEEGLAGNPAANRPGVTAEIYFPHIGSVYDYFLKGIQKALRPKILKDEEKELCQIENTNFQSESLLKIIAEASQWANIPVQLLVTVVEKEGCGSFGSANGLCALSDGEVDQYSAPGAQYPRNCHPTGGGASGPMQIPNSYFGGWGNAVNLATSEGRVPNNCNIKDSIFAAAWILSAGFAKDSTPPYDVNNSPDPSAWTLVDMERALTMWVNGYMEPGQAVCTNRSGILPGACYFTQTYCNKIVEYNSTITSTCNTQSAGGSAPINPDVPACTF